MVTKNGCLVCGQDLDYKELSTYKCIYCGNDFDVEVACIDGHYVCDSCHSSNSLNSLELYISGSDEKDPIKMLHTMMQHPSYNMHGPEHHYLLPAVFLTAIKNNGYEVPDNYWQLVMARCSDLPGGTCGFWGACAACLGVGVAISILKQCNPMKELHYDQMHGANADALYSVARVGGPRCCKRNLMLSADSFVRTLKDDFNIELESSNYKCNFMKYNKECLVKDCPYFPGD